MYHFLFNPPNRFDASAKGLGEHRSPETPAPTAGGRPRACLIIAHEDANRPYRAVGVTGDWLLIGRAQGNDVVLSNALRLVSQRHAEIRWQDERFWLVDLGSKNGTWLDGLRLETGRRYVLRSGARFVVGDFQMTFTVSDWGSACG